MMVSLLLLLQQHHLAQFITGAGIGLGFTVFDAAAFLVAFFAGVFVFDFRTVFIGVLELAGSVLLLMSLVGAEFDNPDPDAPWGAPRKLYEEDDVVGPLLKAKHPVIWSSLRALACRSKPLPLPFFFRDSLSSIGVVSGGVPVLSPSSSN